MYTHKDITQQYCVLHHAVYSMLFLLEVADIGFATEMKGTCQGDCHTLRYFTLRCLSQTFIAVVLKHLLY